MNTVLTTEMPLLQQRVLDCIRHLCQLTEVSKLSQQHMEFNTQVINEFQHLPSVFKEHNKVIAEQTLHCQSDLKVSARASPTSSVLLCYSCNNTVVVCVCSSFAWSALRWTLQVSASKWRSSLTSAS